MTTDAESRTVPRLARPQFIRTVAPGVVEEHSRRCQRSRGGRRCDCAPRYVARVKRAGRSHQHSFSTLAEATAWTQTTRETLRAGGTFASRSPAPALADLAVSFLHHAKRGEALTRSRRPYGAQTLASYEVALRLRVLSHVDGRSGLTFAELPADAIDARTMQNLVDAIAIADSPARARVAAAALAAVLRFGFERGYVDNLPPRVTLPPPPPGRKRRLELDEAAKLLEAARKDDERLRRSLLEPLVALLVASGLRLSEALSLVWGLDGLDLNRNPPVARIAEAKTPAGIREVTLEQETATMLRRHRLACGRPFDGSPVFAGENGKALDRHGRIRFGLARVVEAAGLEGVTAHVLRHAHASWLADAGVSPTAAAARLGHADGGALFLRVYAHAGERDGAAVIDLLSALRKRVSSAPGRSRDVQAQDEKD